MSLKDFDIIYLYVLDTMKSMKYGNSGFFHIWMLKNEGKVTPPRAEFRLF